MFELARGYSERRHDAPTSRCRRPSSPPRPTATRATKHQRVVGAGYFDDVTQTVVGRASRRLTALKGSTEEEQFAAAH